MTEKSWFILRYNHFPPDGPIKLGQLLENPCEPHQPIDFDGPAAFPSDMSVVLSVEEDFSWGVTQGSKWHAGFSAQLDGLPINGIIQAEFKKTKRDWVEFDSLETKIIAPTLEYIKESMARPSVKEFLGKHFLPKRVFMITGLKIARTAKRGRDRIGGTGGQLQLQVTPSPLMPIHLGPDIGASSERATEWCSSASEFIWAFSLRQVHYRRGVVGRVSVYADGATLEKGGDENEDEDESEGENPQEHTIDPTKLEVIVDGLDSKDFTGENSDLVSIAEIHHAGNEQLVVTSGSM